MQRMWGKKISDLSFSQFVKVLEYVAEKKGKKVHKINRYFSSSKTCFSCDHIYKDLSLNERTWTCLNCLAILDRDINAAKNILREGASSLGLDIVRLENSSEYCLKPESNVL